MEPALVKDCAARRKQENYCTVFRIEAVRDLTEMCRNLLSTQRITVEKLKITNTMELK